MDTKAQDLNARAEQLLERPLPAALAIAMLDRELAALQAEDRARRLSISWPPLGRS